MIMSVAVCVSVLKCGKSYGWVQHVAGQKDAGDVDDVVAATADTSGQRPEANGRSLSDNDPGSRRRTKGE